MKFDCAELAKYLQAVSLIRHCDIVKDNSVRVSTPIQYPNGSFVDVFLETPDDLFSPLVLTDKGQTFDYLADLQIRPNSSKRRKALLADICESLGVKSNGSELYTHFAREKIAEIPDHLLRLAQACVRVTDISFTHRFRRKEDFYEDVEEFIAGTDLKYEAGPKLIGKFNNEVEVDFLVNGRTSTSVIQTLSTLTAAAHQVANEVFRKWHDLELRRSQQQQHFTVYDSSIRNAIREEDLARLGDVSRVVAFPAEDEELRKALAA